MLLMQNILHNCGSYLTSIGFVPVIKGDLTWYERTGKTLGILPYGDYLFFHTDVSSPEAITARHEVDRVVINARYRVPKALRLAVPNIVSIFFLEESPTSQMIELVHRATRNVVGGEIHAIVLVDLATRQIHLPSNTSYVLNVQGIEIANKLADKADPTNRANSILQAMFIYGFSAK